ncbi:MAG: hypothetical protein ABSC47_10230, partial [Terracidiphilus sp.]
GACAFCQARLKEYIEIGVELRRIASLESLEVARPRAREKRQAILSIWWQIGWETMRIPRLAFGMLVVGIAGLSSSLVMVGVRAHSKGTVVTLKIPFAKDRGYGQCPLSTEDKKEQGCGFEEVVDSGELGYRINFLAKEGDRIKIGVRAKVFAREGDMNAQAAFANEPEEQCWFKVGETLKVDVPGREPLAITGDWMDHMPVMFEQSEHPNLDPGPDNLRIISPILLHGKEVVDEFERGSAGGKGEVAIYFPDKGLYEISLSPKEGFIEGRVTGNKIEFEIDGQSYAFITGAPITRSEKVWILHTANFKPRRSPANDYVIGAGDLSKNPLL